MLDIVLPEAVTGVFTGFAGAMTRPTFQRFVIIALGAILCRGRRTITRITWLMKLYARDDMSDFHRVFSIRNRAVKFAPPRCPVTTANTSHSVMYWPPFEKHCYWNFLNIPQKRARSKSSRQNRKAG